MIPIQILELWLQLITASCSMGSGQRDAVCTEDVPRTVILYLECLREGMDWQALRGSPDTLHQTA